MVIGLIKCNFGSISLGAATEIGDLQLGLLLLRSLIKVKHLRQNHEVDYLHFQER